MFITNRDIDGLEVSSTTCNTTEAGGGCSVEVSVGIWAEPFDQINVAISNPRPAEVDAWFLGPGGGRTQAIAFSAATKETKHRLFFRGCVRAAAVAAGARAATMPADGAGVLTRTRALPRGVAAVAACRPARARRPQQQRRQRVL